MTSTQLFINLLLRVRPAATFSQLLVLIICFSAFMSSTPAQKRSLDIGAVKTKSSRAPALHQSSVTPVVVEGNVTCADLNALPNTAHGGAFAHIVDNNELKLDFPSPIGTFDFRNYTSPFGPVALNGTQPSPIQTLTLSSAGSSVFFWVSQVAITAVNVKAGNTSFIYPYSPRAFADNNLITGDPNETSHLVFCYTPAVIPTAAHASIKGRVTTSDGVGIRGAALSLLDATTGESRTAVSRTFGYYTFAELPVSDFYILTIGSKRYRFQTMQRSFTLTDDIADLDFISVP